MHCGRRTAICVRRETAARPPGPRSFSFPRHDARRPCPGCRSGDALAARGRHHGEQTDCPPRVAPDALQFIVPNKFDVGRHCVHQPLPNSCRAAIASESCPALASAAAVRNPGSGEVWRSVSARRTTTAPPQPLQPDVVLVPAPPPPQPPRRHHSLGGAKAAAAAAGNGAWAIDL